MVLSFPGDVDADDYIERCPAPMPVQVTLTGIVGQTSTPPHVTTVALRSMEVKTYVWDPVSRSVSFTALALFPNTPRWQNTPLPRRGALVSIMGEIVGKKEDGDQVVVLIQSFNFISVRGTEIATEMSDEGKSSPNTPPTSRWMSWQSKSTTAGSPRGAIAGNKRANDVANAEEDAEEDSHGIISPSKRRRRGSLVSGVW
jgi:hypothetical protein